MKFVGSLPNKDLCGVVDPAVFSDRGLHGVTAKPQPGPNGVGNIISANFCNFEVEYFSANTNFLSTRF